MNRLNDDTLNKALDALIDIENDKLPNTKGLFALQQAVWGWLEPDREKSLLASNLFKQATKINKSIKKKNEILEIDTSIQNSLDSGLNKSDAIGVLAGKKLCGEVSGIWSKASPRLGDTESETKRVAKLRRINSAIEHVKNLKP